MSWWGALSGHELGLLGCQVQGTLPDENVTRPDAGASKNGPATGLPLSYHLLRLRWAGDLSAARKVSTTRSSVIRQRARPRSAWLMRALGI